MTCCATTYDEDCSKRQIAGYLQISPGTVRNYLRRAEAAGVSRPLPAEYTDETLEALLFPRNPFPSDRPQPDWTDLNRQLSRKGMTLEQIWHNYRQVHPQYAQGCPLPRCSQKLP